ncbi:MAG: hypothetical protein E6I99_15930 [Chloroflexi bacterium]|nr:MAG: hypothetical protein E6I99_15930 [Chloroflexota bacterium]
MIWLPAFSDACRRLAERRQSNAAHQRLRRHQDPLAFASVRDDIAHELLREEAEKPSRGHAEDQIVAAIDQRRRRERG